MRLYRMELYKLMHGKFFLAGLPVILAVHLSPERRSCSVQIITREGGLYREFPISMFRINRKKGIMQIGENFFSPKGIRLRLEARRSAECGQETGGGDSGEENVAVEGVLRFGKFSELGYDIMGPFARIPWMQCRHTFYGDNRISLYRKQDVPLCHLPGRCCGKIGGRRTGDPPGAVPCSDTLPQFRRNSAESA